MTIKAQTDNESADFKAAWIKALRSGDYKQGRMKLRNLDDEYCCLGVLCDVYAKTKGQGNWDKEDARETNLFIFENDGFDSIPPDKITQAANLGLADSDATDMLINMNDSAHLSFDQIANHLESL